MSTPSTPGMPSQPATGWYPSLDGQGLPRSLTNGIQQGFTLIYSLRDTVTQLQTTVMKLHTYDSHLNRINNNAQSMPDCALWWESDRQTAFYQARLSPKATTRDWFYAGGIYADLLEDRPTDLDQKDLGFLFLAIDTSQLYRWDGTAWSTV